MEKKEYDRILDHLRSKTLPSCLSKNVKDSLRRKSKQFVIKDDLLYFKDVKRQVDLQVSTYLHQGSAQNVIWVSPPPSQLLQSISASFCLGEGGGVYWLKLVECWPCTADQCGQNPTYVPTCTSIRTYQPINLRT